MSLKGKILPLWTKNHPFAEEKTNSQILCVILGIYTYYWMGDENGIDYCGCDGRWNIGQWESGYIWVALFAFNLILRQFGELKMKWSICRCHQRAWMDTHFAENTHKRWYFGRWWLLLAIPYTITYGISQRQQLGNLALSGHLDWYNFRGHEISWMTPNDWINRRFFEHWSQFFQAVFAFWLPNGFAKRVVAEQTAVTISHQSEQTTGCRDFCAPWEKDSPQPGLPASRNREGAREVAWTKAFADEFAPVENPRYPADSLTHPTHQLVEWSGLYLACWSEHKSLTQLHFFLEKKEFRHLFKF